MSVGGGVSERIKTFRVKLTSRSTLEILKWKGLLDNVGKPTGLRGELLKFSKT